MAINQNRVIVSVPQAYEADASPYKLIDFNETVKSACTTDRASIGSKLCKAVIVGDVSVGKTSLVNRFCHHVFNKDYKATIGVDFEVERFSVLSHPFTLQIWDTAGQERFRSIASSYYKGANVVVVAFDCCDAASLTNAERWHSEAVQVADRPLVFLIGTKSDILPGAAHAKLEEEASKMAAKLNAEYWLTSSLKDENVTELFSRVAALAFNEMVLRELESPASSSSSRQIGNSRITLQKNAGSVFERKKKCCK